MRSNAKARRGCSTRLLRAICAFTLLGSTLHAQEPPAVQALFATVRPANALESLEMEIGFLLPPSLKHLRITDRQIAAVEESARGNVNYYMIGELTATDEDVVRFRVQLYRVRDAGPAIELSPNRPIAESKFNIDLSRNPDVLLTPFLRYVDETLRNLTARASSQLLLADCIRYDGNALAAKQITEEYARVLRRQLTSNGWIVAGIEGGDYEILCSDAGSSYPLRRAYPNRVYGTLFDVPSEIAHNLHWETSTDSAVTGEKLAAGPGPIALAEAIASMFQAHATRSGATGSQ